MPLQYRLKSNLKDLIAKQLPGEKKPTAEKFVDSLPAWWRHRINWRHLHNAASGAWESFSRDELNLLFNMSQRLLEKPFLQVVDHELWADFFRKRVTTTGYIDRDEFLRRQFEKQLIADENVLGLFRHGTNPIVVEPRTPRDFGEVSTSIKTQNGLFIGGPKLNRFTEVALCTLFEGKALHPHDGSTALPFTFQWNDPNKPEWSSFFASEVPGNPRGLTINRAERAYHLAVPEFPDQAQHGRDVGVCVVVRFSVRSKATVTSIILAGATSKSTELMAEALLVDDLPSGLIDLEPGKPVWFFHDHRWKRETPAGMAETTSSEWLESEDSFKAADAYKLSAFSDSQENKAARDAVN